MFSPFLTEYKLLFKKQFGFRNNHSTSHALISLTDLIKIYLDNDYFVCGVFIDLQKAFVTVNVKHEILLFTVFQVISQKSFSFKSIMSIYYVNLLGHLSSVKTVACGVPQGSKLGPLLFLL